MNARAMLICTRTGRKIDGCRSTWSHHSRTREFSEADVGIVAEHVNPPTSPPHMRLLCRLRAPWPDGYEPLSAPEFQPIA